jgi:hypothetical protein
MSKHIDEQISEFIDDEMSVDQCAFFVRRLQRDEAARSRFRRYQMIGVALRGEHLAFNAAQANCVSPAPAATPSAESGTTGSRNRVAVVTGIAASIALAAIFVANYAGLEDFGGELFGTGLDSAGSVAGFAGSQSDVMGIQYVMQHTGFTSGLSRTNMHSSVIAGPLFEIDEESADDATR